MMRNITFLSKEFGFTYQDIMSMPYGIFLSYLRWGKQLMLERSPEFVEKLEDYNNIQETEPEIDKLRNLSI